MGKQALLAAVEMSVVGVCGKQAPHGVEASVVCKCCGGGVVEGGCKCGPPRSFLELGKVLVCRGEEVSGVVWDVADVVYHPCLKLPPGPPPQIQIHKESMGGPGLVEKESKGGGLPAAFKW